MNSIKNNKLKITKSDSKVLSKNQKLFNKYTEQIESLEKKIEQSYTKNEAILQFFSERMTPLLKKELEIETKIAFIIDELSEKYTFSKKQLYQIGDVICGLLQNMLTQETSPADDVIGLFNKWNDTSYEEIQEQEMSEVSEIFSNMTGMDIDMKGFKTPEDFARFAFELQEKMQKEEEQRKEQREQKRKEKKKTPKQIQAEMAKEIEEKQKLKTLRSIYISLAKILHPDTETDEIAKLQKEELMKKVTTAYNEKDITTLLKLEIEWITLDAKNIESLADEKLKVYNDMLKEQVKELEIKLQLQNQNPRYSILQGLINISEKSAKREIEIHQKELQESITELEISANLLENGNLSKKEIINSIRQFKQDNEAAEFEQFLLSMMKH